MMCGVLSVLRRIVLVTVVISLFILPSFGAVTTQSSVLISTSVSEVEVIVDDNIADIGFTVNGERYTGLVYVLPGQSVVVYLDSYPSVGRLSSSIEGDASHILGGYYVLLYNIRSTHVTLTLNLSGIPSNPNTPIIPDNPASGNGPNVPGSLDTPSTGKPGTDNPSTPSEPENPDTPGTDEPGSDEPYLPILPPAGSVYNLAGFIPLGAGALLLFLALFWKRKVYRILKSHAKKHGEKPEKEHLKEIADAIIKLVRDEGKYPEWKKNSDVMRRLGVDICELLDEMNYPKIVPREALVTEILKAARGRINRHRL